MHKMKKLNFLLSLFVVFPLLVSGQKVINVNYYKTSHILFPSDIVYKSSIEDIVTTNIPEAVKNILQIKANKKNFGETNLSVATSDGKFYNYRLLYTEAKNNTVLNETTKKINSSDELRLNTATQIHFILPDKIVYVDYGDDAILAKQGENTENIVMVKAIKPDFTETNISFATAKGDFYTYNVTKGKPEKTVYDFSAGKDVLLVEQKIIANKEQILSEVYSHGRQIYNIGQKNGRVVFSLNNLYSNSDVLYFLFSIENKSSLAYDIKYIKFSVEYEKQSKKIASQDDDLEISFKDRWLDRIDVKSKNLFVVGVPKMALNSKQILRIYLSENNGGRNFILNVPESILTDARYIQ